MRLRLRLPSYGRGLHELQREEDVILVAVDAILVEQAVVLLGVVNAEQACAGGGDRVPGHFTGIKSVSLPGSAGLHLAVDDDDVGRLDHNHGVGVVLVAEPGSVRSAWD